LEATPESWQPGTENVFYQRARGLYRG